MMKRRFGSNKTGLEQVTQKRIPSSEKLAASQTPNLISSSFISNALEASFCVTSTNVEWKMANNDCQCYQILYHFSSNFTLIQHYLQSFKFYTHSYYSKLYTSTKMQVFKPFEEFYQSFWFLPNFQALSYPFFPFFNVLFLRNNSFKYKYQ